MVQARPWNSDYRVAEAQPARLYRLDRIVRQHLDATLTNGWNANPVKGQEPGTFPLKIQSKSGEMQVRVI